MDFITILLFAVALAMDAFTVSVCGGMTIRDLKLSQSLKISFCFGGFQAVMPILGWLAGLTMSRFVGEIDHWVAFTLLGLIGGKMIYDSWQGEECIDETQFLNNWVLLSLGIATSIDAFAVGLTFAFLKGTIWTSALIIGLVTFGFCLVGVRLGERFGGLVKHHIGAVGGIILIGIGVKILVQHIMA